MTFRSCFVNQKFIFLSPKFLKSPCAVQDAMNLRSGVKTFVDVNENYSCSLLECCRQTSDLVETVGCVPFVFYDQKHFACNEPIIY